MDELLNKVKGEPGDFILFCADKLSTVRRVLGGLRLDIAKDLKLIDNKAYKFAFVTDFPQFEYSEEEGKFIAAHHPFTMPKREDVAYLSSDLSRVRAQAYDVVLNGVELGSGSIRIHDSGLQEKMFKALGFSQEEIAEKFGFMVNAFKYGTPPHGGFAFGLDRFVMLMVGAESLREVIAFPKLKDASCPLTEAPSPVEEEQLEILKLFQGSNASERRRKVKSKEEITIDIDNISNLARLYLTTDEKEALKEEMTDIIKFSQELSSVEAENVPMTAHVMPLKNILREDKIVNNFSREEMLKNAPTRDEEYIVVPRVVE